MPNFDGGHYFLTALIPVRLGLTKDPADNRRVLSHVHATKEVLASMPTESVNTALDNAEVIPSAPFSRDLRTQLARLVVIDDVVYNGRVHQDALLTAVRGPNPVITEAVDHLPWPYQGPNPPYQEMEALVEPNPDGPPGSVRFSRMEHFGFTDGFGDPVFEGQYPDSVVNHRVIGQGKLTAEQNWVPLATGEFLLGYPDEAQEIPGAAVPLGFCRNGAFLAYRKLHQNVKSFADYISTTATQYGACNDLTQQQAEETLKAKMAGRWTDGVPVVVAPTYNEWQAFRDRLAKAKADNNQPELDRLNRTFTDFTYAGDADGSKCPFSSHLRRSNPRDMLDPTVVASPSKKDGPKDTSVLNNRHRLLRRGLPYGGSTPINSDQEEQGGFITLSLCKPFQTV